MAMVQHFTRLRAERDKQTRCKKFGNLPIEIELTSTRNREPSGEMLPQRSRTLPTRRRACRECRTIARAVQKPPRTDGWGVDWNYEQAKRNSSCPTCRELVAVLAAEEWCLPKSDDDVRAVIQFEDFKNAWKVALQDRQEPSWVLGPCCDLLHAGRRPDPTRGIGRAVDDQQIDLDILTSWIKSCDERDGGHCHSISDVWATFPTDTDIILVDAENLCLVRQRRTRNPPRYVALSYVWGRTCEPFQTVRNNVTQLSIPGALSVPTVWACLPRTIRDTITLICNLGIRFLWVDRLCIVQDDADSKHTQLAAMASIYVNAYFTIVATEGDAETGLAGATLNATRKKPFREFQFSPSCRMIEVDPILAIDSHEMIYHSRGWTFQEWTLSRRVLVFHHQTVTWKCQQSQQQENGRVPPDIWAVQGHIHGSMIDPVWTSWPNLKSYARMVEEYNNRDLSYQEDALHAFAAITAVHGRTMKGEMIFGVPELFFTGFLLWKIVWQKPERRDKTSSTYLPSWSWVGWKGVTSLWFTTEYAYEYVAHNILPTSSRFASVQHFSVPSIFKVRIMHGQRRRERIKDLHYWREIHPNRTTNSQCLPQGYEFTGYVPLIDVKAVKPTAMHRSLLPYIEMHTSRIFGSLRATSPEGLKVGGYERPEGMFILGHSGNAIGCVNMRPKQVDPRYLNLRFCEALDLEGCNIDRSEYRDDRIELINIGGMDFGCSDNFSRGLRRFPGSDYLHRHCPIDLDPGSAVEGRICWKDKSKCLLGSDWSYKIYNVLWIEWKDGIAYRLGVGMVWKEFWEGEGPDEIDVVLG